MPDADLIRSLSQMRRARLSHYIDSLRKRGDLTKRERRDLVEREATYLLAEQERRDQRSAEYVSQHLTHRAQR